jgi:hypothetical protein
MTSAESEGRLARKAIRRCAEHDRMGRKAIEKAARQPDDAK